MKIEIDQSGKVEETQHDTVVAFSNGSFYSIRITRKTKRQIQEVFRKMEKPKRFMIETFCALVFLIIKDHYKAISSIEIDKEYHGREKDILTTLKLFFEAESLDLPAISFINIGKKSKAHQIAIEVYRKKLKPNKLLNFQELKAFIVNKQK